MPSECSERQVFHEIKNSLAILSSSLSLLEKSHPEVLGFNYWPDIQTELCILRESIEDYSQLSHRTQTLSRLSVKDVVTLLEQQLRPIRDAHSFVCKITIENHLPDFYGDAYRVRSCLTNLVKNSFEAMEKTGTVFLNISQEDRFIRFDLQDFGGGIPPENTLLIYNPEFTTKPYGSGMGLAITKQFVSEMNGVLACCSRPGDGTTFTIKLPIYEEV